MDLSSKNVRNKKYAALAVTLASNFAFSAKLDELHLYLVLFANHHLCVLCA